MNLPGSLKTRIALGSGALFLLLYTLGSALVLWIDASSRRQELEVLLYAQAESLASYYSASHRLDYPELRQIEQTAPFPVWMRVVRDGRVVAQTPGLPHLAVAKRRPEIFGHLETMNGNGPRLALVAHEVWTEPGTVVEAISSLELLKRRRRDLGFALGVAGLLLVPLAAFGVQVVAARGLRPVDSLVASIRALDSDRLEQRLAAPGAVTEITALTEEFNRLLGRLEESVEAMRRFTADASHELRTPISILRTGIEVALRKDRPPQEYQELLHENLEEIERIQRIVETLLALARSQRGDPKEMRRDPVDFSAVVERAVDSIRALAGEREVGLDPRVASGIAVLGDVDQLRLMVLNLLDNAVKFTPRGRRIHVLLEEVAGSARLEVRDEGPGIPPEERPHVFDRFYRGRTGRSASSSTGGLGLSVISWVAQNHGGQIRLLDNGFPGAAFEVLIPGLAEETARVVG
jgi:heavy metal sensor kinase